MTRDEPKRRSFKKNQKKKKSILSNPFILRGVRVIDYRKRLLLLTLYYNIMYTHVRVGAYVQTVRNKRI